MKIKQNVTNEWTKWFAWHPVTTIDGEVIWFEMVYRRLTHARAPNIVPSSWTIYMSIEREK